MGDRSESLTARIGLDSSPFVASIQKARGSVGEFTSFISAGAAAIGAFKLFEKAKEAMEFAHQIKQTSDALGISTGMLQTFQVATTRSGREAEDATKGIEHLARTVGEARAGNAEAISKFTNLGIAFKNTDGSARPLGDILKDVSAKVRDTAAGADKANIAFGLFGKEGVKLIPALSNDLGELNKKFDETGRIIKERNIDALEQFEKVVKRISSRGKGMFANLFGEALGSTAQEFRKTLKGLGDAADAARNRQSTASDFISGPKRAALNPQEVDDANKALEKLNAKTEELRQSGMNLVEKLGDTHKQLTEQRQIAEAARGSSAERFNAETKIVELMAQEKSLMNSITADQMKLVKEIGKAKFNLDKEQKGIQTAKSDTYKFSSVEDLMASTADTPFVKEQQQRGALEQQYEAAAKQAGLQGDFKTADKYTQSSIDIRKHMESLQSNAKDPYAASGYSGAFERKPGKS